ncbi:MAG: helicase-associated domain-containing protein [Roseiflexaceae bacterium]
MPDGYDPTAPLIIQSDGALLLDPHSPRFAAAREAIAPFAELEASPEDMHRYRISPLSLWSAAAAGFAAEELERRLLAFARYPAPPSVLAHLREQLGRWGRLRLLAEGDELRLLADDATLLEELSTRTEVAALLGPARGPLACAVPPERRGLLKQALTAAGWPVEDLAGYVEGAALPVRLREEHFALRDYQREAAAAFYQGGAARGGSGVVVLPPGAGKTLVGLAALALVGQQTLILTTSNTSVQQWQRELLARTDLLPEQIGQYTGADKRIAPVTLSTYQMLTFRSERDGSFPHLRLFTERPWGLLIYDEVHSLPAPVFRATASIQARRRLGLTATLIREDGREGDVFALIGPKRYELPWRELERRGWIAPAACTEVRVGLPEDERLAYATAEPRDQPRLAAANPRKLPLLRAILEQHPGAPTLVIGQYLDQLQHIADNLAAPLITGKTPQPERERLFAAFRRGAIGSPLLDRPLLVISKVGNFALDLPDAELLVQVSGTFGSRQEEAQRLGRVLRPKPDGRHAYFYTLVTRDTRELEFAHKRQLFLAEQGYRYEVRDAGEWVG